ncbi:MAG: hypothetical protein ACHQNT_02010 [Bacteroidia bacterium]
MKKILALVIAAVITTGAYAQSNKEDVDLIQAMYGKAKKELVIEYMQFSTTEATAFWTTYDAFEIERKVLGRERISIISDYADHYTTLDDIKAADLGKKIMDNNVALEKLNQKYFPKFSTAVGALKAAKYMQLELYMQTAVRMELQDNIPFINAVDKTKKDIQ